MGVIMTAFSLASILGVPAGFEFARRFDWHMPFAILVRTRDGDLIAARYTLPTLPPHRHATAMTLGKQMTRSSPTPITSGPLRSSPPSRARAAMIYPYLAPSMVSNAGMPEKKWCR